MCTITASMSVSFSKHYANPGRLAKNGVEMSLYLFLSRRYNCDPGVGPELELKVYCCKVVEFWTSRETVCFYEVRAYQYPKILIFTTFPVHWAWI